jgi:hypothetical protein
MQISPKQEKKISKRKLSARIAFCIGIIFSLLGMALMLLTLADGARQRVISAFLLLIIGGGCVFVASKLRRRSLYLFFAAFLTLVILFFLLKAIGISGFTLKQSWPLLSVFAGLALLLAGAAAGNGRRYYTVRRIYLIPAIALVILGGFLLLFSLQVTNFSFKQFVLGWGPVIIAVSGIMLILLASMNSKERA